MKVLAIAAHPDDEVLGCGATLARFASEGHDVHVAILGQGSTSRNPDSLEPDHAEVEALADAARCAAAVIGAKSVFLGGLPDNRLDSVVLLEIARLVESVIEDHAPDLVFTHHSGDLNVDHRRIFEAVAIATRPVEGTHTRDVLLFEVASSTEWAFHTVNEPFHPSVFFDVSTTIDRKIEAMRCYSTEVRPFPHPRSEENLRAAATHWGAAAGMRAAEAFQPLRMLR